MIKRGLKPRLAEIGKIKIGGKGKSYTDKKGIKRQIPTRYEHFVVTTTERGKDGNFVPDYDLMMKLNPKEEWASGQTMPEPKEIKVLFLFDDVDMNFRTSFAFYQGAKCMCRGDGETAERLFLKAGKQETLEGIIDVRAGEKHTVKCDPETCPFMQPDSKGVTQCKPSGIMSCLIPESMEIGGVYRFRTHSWNTISNILASLELIKTITGGVLVGIPMKLRVLKKATESHGNVTTVTVAFDGKTQQEIRELAFTEMKNRSDFGVNMKLIEDDARRSGFLIDTDEPEDIEAEFYTQAPETEKVQKKNIINRAESVLDNVKTEIDIPDGYPTDVSDQKEPEIIQEEEPYNPEKDDQLEIF